MVDKAVDKVVLPARDCMVVDLGYKVVDLDLID